MKLGFILDKNEKFIEDYLVPAKDMMKSFQEAEFDDEVFYPDKIQGYKIDYIDCVPHASFSQELWEEYQASLTQESAKSEAQVTFEELAKNYTLASASDADALKMKCLYDAWKGDGTKYKKDDRLTYNDKLYRVLKTHKSQAEQTPDKATDLYIEITETMIENNTEEGETQK